MIKNGLIVLLVLFAVFLLTVKRRAGVITKTTVDTVFTTKNVVKYTKGSDIFVRTLDTVNLVKIDTVFTIRDYNTVKEYQDTIVQDSNRYVITDTISQNKILGRSFRATLQEKTITYTHILEAPRRASLYVGYRSDISHNYTQLAHSVTLQLKTRDKGIWSVGYGTNGYSLGYALKLKL